MPVKSEPTDDPCEIGALVDTGSPLIPSQDPSKAKNTKESTDSEEKESKGSKESSKDKLPTVLQLVALTRERPIQKKRQRKDYTKILPPSLVSLRVGRRRSKKFDSQNKRDK